MFLEAVPDLKVTIHSNGQQLAEYDDEDSFPTAVEKTKFVEAESGANFSVSVVYHSSMARDPQDCLKATVYLDGQRVISKVYHTGKDNGSRARVIEGKIKNTYGGTLLERFQFAHLQTTDGPIGKVKLEDLKDLGEIKVRVLWVRTIGEGKVVYSSGKRWESAVGSSVPEKCLKGRAVSSHATVGPPEMSRRGQHKTHQSKSAYGDDPLAVFKFKYRSRRDLQIEGIIPRSPSPLPLEERDVATLSREELIELHRRRDARDAEQVKVKREGVKREGVKREGQKRARSSTLEGDSDPDEVTIIDEGPARKRNRSSTDSAIEIVDLTED